MPRPLEFHTPGVRTKALSCLQRVAPKGPGVEGTRYVLSGLPGKR